MPIEAETFFRGKSIGIRKLKPGTTLTTVERERWIPRDPYIIGEKLFVVCTVVDQDSIEVRTSFYNLW